MDHENAATLLEETFDNEFNIDRYANFIKELFNHIKISIRDVPLRKEYYNYIETVNSFGVYRDSDKRSIEVFAIKLKRTSSLDRARTMQRNLIARYLSQFNLDAALVAFYGDNPEDWRFSFVKMEYELTKDEKGNLKVSEELTPATRYSFLVGKNESNHTCKIQFLGLIKEEEVDPQLAEIEEKFSIEKVTNEFFTAYKKLFLDLNDSLEDVIDNDPLIKQEFKEKNILTTDFAKKLLGQIVFIYFLQKKGWLGVKKQESWGSGPKNFLRMLFNKEMANYDNFFNEMLEPLFYEALATERDGDYYSRFNCRIPFLNGGLFEPINDYDWIGTDITLNNEIFKEILDTFDLFNFTVKEDEPLEKEVAVDPEMLGKVFEKLLKVTDRKSKGAFYTPREIVHYMCQQSLINYLETNLSHLSNKDIEKFILKGDLALDSIIREQEQNRTYHGRIFQKQLLPESIKENSGIIDKLLMDIKIVDPAVGSGAFPVGMMNEIVKARHIISLLLGKEVNNYNLKRETIENSLYGVDIDSSAVDITKLRFWLSLVVDEEKIQNIKPLPNLDHKIMCGNSLIEEFEGTKLFDENLLEIPEINPAIEKRKEEKKDLEEKLLQLMNEDSKNVDKISDIDNQISKLRKKIKKITSKSNNQSQASLFASESQIKLKQLKEKHEQFFNAESPNKKKNLRQEIDLIEWEFIEETLKSEGNGEKIERLREYKKNKSKPFFLWKLYFHEVFQRENPGFDVVIANPPYITLALGKKQKLKISKTDLDYYNSNFESSEYKGNTYVIFLEKGISLLRDKGILAFITPNTLLTNYYFKKSRGYVLKSSKLRLLMNFSENVFEDAETGGNLITVLQKDNENLTEENYFKVVKVKDLTNFHLIKPEFLNQQLFYSIPDYKFLLDEKKLNIILKIKTNCETLENLATFYNGIKTGDNKKFLSKSKKSPQYQEVLRGRDISKYSIKFNNNYVLFDKEKLWSNTDESKFLANEKIIVRQTSDSLIGAYDNNQYFTLDTTHLIIPNKSNPKYLLAIINSKLMNFYYQVLVPETGKTFAEVKIINLKKLPIHLASSETEEHVKTLVDKIIFLKSQQLNSKEIFESMVTNISNLNYISLGQFLSSEYAHKFIDKHEFVLGNKKKEIPRKYGVYETDVDTLIITVTYNNGNTEDVLKLKTQNSFIKKFIFTSIFSSELDLVRRYRSKKDIKLAILDDIKLPVFSKRKDDIHDFIKVFEDKYSHKLINNNPLEFEEIELDKISAEIEHITHELNKIIYNLYGLSEDDISTIEIS